MPEHSVPHAASQSDAWVAAQYNVRAMVADFAAITQRWSTQGAAARASARLARLDLAYGPAAGERLDLFPVDDPAAPLLVFIHGGFFRALDKADFAWIAAPYNARGIAVAITNYTLAPQSTVAQIVRQQLRASAWLWHHGPGLGFERRRMFVSGHSAGGHLGAMLLAALWQHWDTSLPDQLYQGAMLLSGVFDLEPIVRVDFLNADLRLTAAEARRVSPLWLPPAGKAPVLAAVGGAESLEFKRQTRAFCARWQAVIQAEIEVPDSNHLTLCEQFAEPGHILFERTVALCTGPDQER